MTNVVKYYNKEDALKLLEKSPIFGEMTDKMKDFFYEEFAYINNMLVAYLPDFQPGKEQYNISQAAEFASLCVFRQNLAKKYKIKELEGEIPEQQRILRGLPSHMFNAYSQLIDVYYKYHLNKLLKHDFNPEDENRLFVYHRKHYM